MRQLAVLIFCLLTLESLCPAPAHAYLDPGTGSMLLSACIGIAATLFFMLKNIVYKIQDYYYRLRGLRLPQRDKGIVFYSEGKQYWQTFQPVITALLQYNIPISYLSSGQDDPGLDLSHPNLVTHYIGQGDRAFAMLNMLEADICVMTTPGLDVLQIKRSQGVRHYVHLVHAMTDMAFYVVYSFDYFDSVMCATPFQISSLRQLEALRKTPQKQLLETGCPYMDAMALALHEKRYTAPPASATGTRLLIAPTWGKNGLLARFSVDEMLLPLAKAGYTIIIRPHPQSSVVEPELLASIKTQMAEYSTVSWDHSPSPLEAMLASDILISDLSGIVFDYAFILERPVITLDVSPQVAGQEAADLPYQAWELGILPQLGAQISLEQLPELPSLIASLQAQTDFAQKMQKLRQEVLFNYTKSGQVAAQQLIHLHTNLQTTAPSHGKEKIE